MAEKDGTMSDKPHFYKIFSEFEVPEKVSVHLHTNHDMSRMLGINNLSFFIFCLKIKCLKGDLT